MVLIGARNFARGEAAAKEIESGAIALPLDVPDRASISAARSSVCCCHSGVASTLVNAISLPCSIHGGRRRPFNRQTLSEVCPRDVGIAT
jgi:NADP-dependent 3-hydroxy acid dehydrogenase YdfG